MTSEDISNQAPTVEFVGFPQEDRKELIAQEWEKLLKRYENKIKEETQLKAHQKIYHTDGSQAKFSITLHLAIAQILLSATGSDWDVMTAVKEAFTGLEAELEKKYRASH